MSGHYLYRGLGGRAGYGGVLHVEALSLTGRRRQGVTRVPGRGHGVDTELADGQVSVDTGTSVGKK